MKSKKKTSRRAPKKVLSFKERLQKQLRSPDEIAAALELGALVLEGVMKRALDGNKVAVAIMEEAYDKRAKKFIQDDMRRSIEGLV